MVVTQARRSLGWGLLHVHGTVHSVIGTGLDLGDHRSVSGMPSNLRGPPTDRAAAARLTRRVPWLGAFKPFRHSTSSAHTQMTTVAVVSGQDDGPPAARRPTTA